MMEDPKYNVLDLMKIKGFDPKYVSSTKGGEYHSPCPICGGEDRFFIQPNHENYIGGYFKCRQCEINGNAIEFVKRFMNCDAKKAFEYLGIKRNGKKSDFKKKSSGKWGTVYDYIENGILRHRTERYKTSKGEKNFSQWKAVNEKEFVNNLDGVETTCFKHDEIFEKIKSEKAQNVIICEGEKDVLTLWAAGFIATCVPGGAQNAKNWTERLISKFAGLNVVLIPDCDRPGLKYVKQIAERFTKYGNLASLKILILPYEKVETHGKDSTDFIDEIGKDKFIELFKNSLENYSDEKLDLLLEINKIEKATSENILDRFGNMVVLGELDGAKILLFSKDTRKVREIEPSKLTHTDIISLTNQSHESSDLMQIKKAMAFRARDRQIWKMETLGSGIFKRNGGLILVNGNDSFFWKDGKKVESIETPIFNDCFIDFGRSWFQFDENKYHKFEPLETFKEIKKTVKKWKFKKDYFGDLVTALIYATPFQNVWQWVPHVYITGKTNSGKTIFFEEFINRIFPGDRLGREFDGKTTEAAIRQAINNRSLFCTIDEFEKFKNQDKVFELLRIANRGGSVVRGSVSGKPINWSIKGIFWIASIQTHLMQAADENRFLVFELDRFGRNERIDLPMIATCDKYFESIIYTGLKHYQDFLNKTDEIIKNCKTVKIHSRVLESLAVPISILSVITGEDFNDLVAMVESEFENVASKEDHEKLIDTILARNVRIDKDSEMMIFDVLEKAKDKSDYGYKEFLRNKGISVTNATNPKTGQRIDVMAILPHHPEFKTLIKGTDWEGCNVKQIIERADGAFEAHLKFNGKNQRFSCVPLNRIIEVEKDEPF